MRTLPTAGQRQLHAVIPCIFIKLILKNYGIFDSSKRTRVRGLSLVLHWLKFPARQVENLTLFSNITA